MALIVLLACLAPASPGVAGPPRWAPLAGPWDGAAGPVEGVTTPEGVWVAWQADGHVRARSAEGGPVVLLPVETPGGAAWVPRPNTQGVVLAWSSSSGPTLLGRDGDAWRSAVLPPLPGTVHDLDIADGAAIVAWTDAAHTPRVRTFPLALSWGGGGPAPLRNASPDDDVALSGRACVGPLLTADGRGIAWVDAADGKVRTAARGPRGWAPPVAASAAVGCDAVLADTTEGAVLVAGPHGALRVSEDGAVSPLPPPPAPQARPHPGAGGTAWVYAAAGGAVLAWSEADVPDPVLRGSDALRAGRAFAVGRTLWLPWADRDGWHVRAQAPPSR